jgi:chemotaxis response regulator CheB
MDATNGVQAVRRGGGAVIAQSSESADHFGMPGSAIATGAVDYVLPVEEIAATLTRLVGGSERPPAAT